MIRLITMNGGVLAIRKDRIDGWLMYGGNITLYTTGNEDGFMIAAEQSNIDALDDLEKDLDRPFPHRTAIALGNNHILELVVVGDLANMTIKPGAPA